MKRLLVVAGPSGIGKTFLAQALLARYPDRFEQGMWHTTRSPRPHEVTSDRIFVSEQEFDAKRDEFFIAEEFHNHWYGYPKNRLESIDRHIIMNIWPGRLPHFKDLPQALFVGLTVDPSTLDLLQARMSDRGYSSEQMQERLELAKKDLDDLANQEALINSNGRIFTITDDTTIPVVVIPWIESTLLN